MSIIIWGGGGVENSRHPKGDCLSDNTRIAKLKCAARFFSAGGRAARQDGEILIFNKA